MNQQTVRQVLLSLLTGLVLPALLLAAAVYLRPGETAPPDATAPTAPPPTAPPVHTTLHVQLGEQVTVMPLSDYLLGVVLAEMPTDFEDEAIKAQTVVSATYALRREENGSAHPGAAVCTSPGCCQAYKDPEAFLAQGGSEQQLERVQNLIAQVGGQVLTYDGDLIEATFFSCSGGYTEDAVAVWGGDVPYLQAVPSPGEEFSRHYTDVTVFTAEDFAARLGIDPAGSPETWFSPPSYTEGGGIDTVTIGGVVFTGRQLREKLGLKSTDIEFAPDASSVTVTTHGYGHRVGMSQYGAQAMALSGSTYDEILAHYYPGTALEPYSN